ncbi:uncharacterized protein [Phaseolus vulgaris]|uniref:uncharacterized protein n=1 Tax=Phaseolus vulgaris TaxID=3885 RepID=UPI0035CB2DFC
MDSSEDFEQELYDGVNVWDDDDIEKSLSKSKGYECTDAFTTNEVFRTRDELLKWVRKVAFDIGFCIVILRSDTSTGQRGRKTFVLLGCERGGQYRRYKKDLQVIESGIRKCACPFRLRGYPVKSGEGWILKLICGSHNHELANTLVDHPYVGRFTCSEKSMLMDMTDSSVKPRNILLTMKEHNEKNVSTIKQVYNARYMYKKSVRGDRTEMQQLMMLLERDMYRMPLFEVVGVTSTGLTFSAVFMLLASERHHNFVWALEKLKGLFLRFDSYPKVVVSDRDIALMNAINVVFSETANLLCRFHIDKNVKAKCKMIVHPKEAWDQVMESWGAIVDCENVESYEHRVEALNVVCSPWPIFTEYVISTWLNPHKEKFVKAWTDKVMHLGNMTSNRVEAAHWSLKRILETSMGDLCFFWESINKMIILQHNAIKSSFEKSLHVVSHVFNVTRYKKLLGFVSKYALQYIAEESDRVEYVGLDKSRISSDDTSAELSIQQEWVVIMNRFNEVDMAGKINIKAKLREIAYPDNTYLCPPREKVKTKGALKGRQSKFGKSTKRIPSYFEHVDAILSQHDSSSSLKCSKGFISETPPTKSIPMLQQFPVGIHPYIVDIVDVKADGHCGYRAVGALLGMGEESWAIVRMNLHKELCQWRQEYIDLFDGDERYEFLKNSLLVDHMINTDKWMTIPNMGYVIANRYNVIVVCLSLKHSLTIFPLRSQPPTDFKHHRIICIGHVHGNHFVQVQLQEGFPIPPTDILWSTYCYPIAKTWCSYYISRMQMFTQIMSIRRYL